jgi:hypothetical protein
MAVAKPKNVSNKAVILVFINGMHSLKNLMLNFGRRLLSTPCAMRIVNANPLFSRTSQVQARDFHAFRNRPPPARLPARQRPDNFLNQIHSVTIS